jgi:hypothetical protein
MSGILGGLHFLRATHLVRLESWTAPASGVQAEWSVQNSKPA